jgi:hypothetical protein
MKFYQPKVSNETQGHLCFTTIYEDQLWNLYAPQFCEPTVFVDNCLGDPYFRSVYGPDIPKWALEWLCFHGVAGCVAAQRLRVIADLGVVCNLDHGPLYHSRKMRLAKGRMLRWVSRTQEARAAGWRTVARMLLVKLKAPRELTPDNVDMIVAQLTLAPQDCE